MCPWDSSVTGRPVTGPPTAEPTDRHLPPASRRHLPPPPDGICPRLPTASASRADPLRRAPIGPTLPAMTTFDGIPQDAVTFYRELAADNSTTWWRANADRYAVHVREPISHLVDLLAADFGQPWLFRPHRDVRFSRDKSPYKEQQGALVGTARGLGWYLQVGVDGLQVGGGFAMAAPDQVARLRAAVDDPASGERLVRIVEALRQGGFEIDGERVKTAPRGYRIDHPRIELLRFKNLIATRRYGQPDWLDTPAVLDHVRADWDQVRPMVDWLTQFVGPADRAR